MNSMHDKVFIDTNIFVYAYLSVPPNHKDYAKHETARKMLGDFSAEQSVVISTQVCNEYYSVLLRNRIEDNAIQSSLMRIMNHVEVVSVTEATVKKSHEIKNRYRFSLWDSLIVASAIENECSVLYSEDMQSGQLIDGSLRVVNPLS